MALRAQAKGTLRLIAVATGLLVATVPVDEIAVSRSGADHAIVLAGKQAAATAVAKLRQGLVKSLREREKQGVEISLTITGVTDAAHGEQLLVALKAIAGVQDAIGSPFNGGLLVTVRSAVPAKDLAKAIAKELTSTLSITSAKGTALEAVAK